MLVDRSSAHDRAYHAAREPRLIERRVLALRLEVDGVKHPGYVGIDYDDIGGGNRAPGVTPAAPKRLGGGRRPAGPSSKNHPPTMTHNPPTPPTRLHGAL